MIKNDNGERDYAIGETFKAVGVTLKCAPEITGCKGCYFYENNVDCSNCHLACTGSTRQNGEAVIFTKIKETMPEKKSILEEAAEIRKGSRNVDYGNAVENFKRIASIASAITGTSITPQMCVAVQMATKLSREAYRHKRDNLVDLCGYADIMEEIHEYIFDPSK